MRICFFLFWYVSFHCASRYLQQFTSLLQTGNSFRDLKARESIDVGAGVIIGILYEALVMKAESAEGFLEELHTPERGSTNRGVFLYQRAEASSLTTPDKRFPY